MRQAMTMPEAVDRLESLFPYDFEQRKVVGEQARRLVLYLANLTESEEPCAINIAAMGEVAEHSVYIKNSMQSQGAEMIMGATLGTFLLSDSDASDLLEDAPAFALLVAVISGCNPFNSRFEIAARCAAIAVRPAFCIAAFKQVITTLQKLPADDLVDVERDYLDSVFCHPAVRSVLEDDQVVEIIGENSKVLALAAGREDYSEIETETNGEFIQLLEKALKYSRTLTGLEPCFFTAGYFPQDLYSV